MSISNMIDSIRRRPCLFLGSNSISALRNFLDGYQAAEREYAISPDRELFPLPFRFMHEYMGYCLHDSSTKGWRLLILNACDGVEEAALQKFFEYYDEFRQIRMKRYWKAVLSEENIAWNDQMKRAYRCSGPHSTDSGPYTISDLTVKEPIFCNPQAVYVIELTISACILAVETADSIELQSQFFTCPEKAKGSSSAEIYFGPVDSWEEFDSQNISFEKKIVIGF